MRRPLRYRQMNLERVVGVEPTTYTLATCRSATELYPQSWIFTGVQALRSVCFPALHQAALCARACFMRSAA